MLSRLNKELVDFLVQFNISPETRIFERTLLSDMAGLTIDAARNDYGFDEYVNRHLNDHLEFRIPNLSLSELRKLLATIKMPEDEYKTGKPVKISENVMFTYLFPQFQKHIVNLMQNEPARLKQYVIDSKPKLESRALEKMNHISIRLQNALNIPGNPVFGAQVWKEANSFLFELRGILLAMEGDRHYHGFVLPMRAKLNDFLKRYPFISADTDLTPHLTALDNAFANYEKYNRFASALAVEQLYIELHAFLNEHKIKESECDVVEESLLRLAGIDCNPVKCNFKKGSDPTRVVFTIIGINKENTQKFITYFHNAGDETAKEGHGYGERFWLGGGVVVAQSGGIEIESSQSKPPETHSVEVDGLVLYEKIFPQFKAHIEECKISAPQILAPYWEISKKFFSASESSPDAVAERKESPSPRLFQAMSPNRSSDDESMDLSMR